MSISEAQLETWSAQGKTGQFTDTYNSIAANLLDPSSPYPAKDCEVFLQGSYGNDTNVHGDSDVDIVLRHKGAFHYNLDKMSSSAQQAFKTAFPNDAQYGYPQFKADAVNWIGRLYNDVAPHKKAVFVPGNSGRRNADVLICQEFRRYHDFTNFGNQRYDEGVAFYADGVRIENFPKQHSANCTAKHQNTKDRYKRMVRVFKNMRNAMIEKGLLAEGMAPSYFIEGMLFNVPDDRFGGTYRETWIQCFNWTVTAERTELVCANRLHWLVRDDSSTSWPVANFNAFMAAAKKFWES